jgi:signal transduction histidine kinase
VRRGSALPAPLPADLVEALPAWPDLDHAELVHLLGGADGLASAVADGAGPLVRSAAVAGAAAARLALDGRLGRERGEELVAWAAADADICSGEARVHVFLRTLLDVVAAAPSSARVLEGLLAALHALGPAEAVRLETNGEALCRPAGLEPGSDVLELPVAGSGAVLLVEPAAGADSCRALAEETARLVGAVLRARSRRSSADVTKLEAAQRRLRRLALDLHDGPAQDVAALAVDAALLQAELASELTPERTETARELAAEIRDRLGALGRDIRDLAEVLEPRAMLREPLRDVLLREVGAFARRTGIAPSVEIDDDLGVMTASQQIALVRVAQEALANVREHARAGSVELFARATAQGVSLAVVDDGKGFDVRRAAARGRLGLAGMEERVRLLGGTLAVDSRPGRGTRVEATIPHWRPAPA